MEHVWIDPAYADMVDNGPMVELYRANLARTGRSLIDPTSLDGIVGSTDMGNISHLVPSIHPMIAVSPPNVAIHTADFVRYARGPEGDRAVLDGARAMAGTVADLWAQPGAMEAARSAFETARADGRATGSATIGAGPEA
jgi:metal-dependent amidase/aminoacylase/carboxypeptidase family protein